MEEAGPSETYKTHHIPEVIFTVTAMWRSNLKYENVLYETWKKFYGLYSHMKFAGKQLWNQSLWRLTNHDIYFCNIRTNDSIYETE
jgi:hypothetical protein